MLKAKCRIFLAARVVAAPGCYDIAERLMGNDLDLVRLLDPLALTRGGMP